MYTPKGKFYYLTEDGNVIDMIGRVTRFKEDDFKNNDYFIEHKKVIFSLPRLIISLKQIKAVHILTPTPDVFLDGGTSRLAICFFSKEVDNLYLKHMDESIEDFEYITDEGGYTSKDGKFLRMTYFNSCDEDDGNGNIERIGSIPVRVDRPKNLNDFAVIFNYDVKRFMNKLHKVQPKIAEMAELEYIASK